MMKTKMINIYKFSELSDKAKERAKNDYMGVFGFSWGDEYLDSLRALAKHFNSELVDWEIDWFGMDRSYVKFEVPSDFEDINIYEKLAELGTFNPEALRGDGDCKLTGVCSDEAAIDGLRVAVVRGERDVNALLQAAFEEWITAARRDCEDEYSDKQFSETSDANDWWYTEDGKIA
jgi:hypothetical protein